MKPMDKYLDKELKKYTESDIYPFHMPGHKRQMLSEKNAEQIDITEVEGFDNLHHATGILANAQERMAEIFGADRSFYLINGSTAGLLSAISGTVKYGGKILIARNSHKAVYNAIYLRGLDVEYVYPEQTAWGIQGSIAPEAIHRKLEENPQIQAVLITSPTYDGVVSDIKTIAQIVHAYNIPLIVDEAHGAHFGFSPGFPKKALSYGADVVIESMHKTLPAYTQSAALHLKGTLVDAANIQRFLSIYQSSSPSYVLMAGLDRCVRILKEDGHKLFSDYEKRLARFYQQTKGLKHLRVLSPNYIGSKDTGIWDKDASKILIFCENTGMSGSKLAEILLKRYGLQMEMDSAHYVTALTSIMDTEEGFERLIAALIAIDDELSAEGLVREEGSFEEIGCGLERSMGILYEPKEIRIKMGAACELQAESILISEAAGRVSTEFAYLYPPGIPFLTPGEVVTESVVCVLNKLQREGFEIQGLEDLLGQRIKVART